MKRKLPLLFGATFLVFAVAACEGPAGPQGPQGAQGDQGIQGPQGPAGEDALNTCSDCHSSDATIVAIEQQFALSPHGFGNFEVRGPDYAGGSCVACHTSQGFEAAVTGTDPDWSVGAASMNCRTCHEVHETFVGPDDFALTTTDPVTLRLTDATVDFSNGVEAAEGGNLCANCHQGRIRDPWPTQITDLTQTFDITSSHFGPHYGTQSNVFAAEIGFAFGTATEGEFFPAHLPTNDLSCTGCHMAREGFTPTPEGPGWHTLQPSPVTCNGCHTGPDVDDQFNYRGTPQAIYNDLIAAGTCLADIGIITIENVPPPPSSMVASSMQTFDGTASLHGGAVIEYHPVEGTFAEPLVASFIVWAALAEDGSWGVHNPSYVRDQAAGVLDFLRTNYPVECPTPAP